MKIYLDNAATTKVDEKVLKEMLPYFNEKYGNASSMHLMGSEAKTALEKARKIIAKSINAKPSEIYFTSGGTESNNWALKGLFWKNQKENTGKNHLITTKIEHDSILKPCERLENQGAKITYLNVNEQGFINIDELKKTITKETFLVSVIHGNNEIGVIQNIEEIGKICKEKKVLFHTDACQSFTKVPIDVKKQNLDLVTINSHKIHGPKGIGALYIKEGIDITYLLHGGGHEKGKRSGTENIPNIVGFAKAVEISNSKNIKNMQKLRDKLINGILNSIPDTNLNGPTGNLRLANNINISFNNIEGESIGGYLENAGIFVSTGSACMSNTLETSHVLKALNLRPLRANSSIRISLSKYTTEKEMDYTLEKLQEIVKKLRRLSPLVK
ncbi:MAG: cysteine desulfurase family protein [Candidatus Pacearchaeota archaeon]|jgi:cysteine desulfurase